MFSSSIKTTGLVFLLLSLSSCLSKTEIKPSISYNFNNSVDGTHKFVGNDYSFEKGIDGKALSFNSKETYNNLSFSELSLDGAEDFSLQFWIKTTADEPTLLISQKDFTNKGIIAQKNAGWALYSSGGTFGWAIGSGDRRINYERENGEKLPLNDGEWHQLSMTYSKEKKEFRLYYDGHNKAIYKVNFDFSHFPFLS